MNRYMKISRLITASLVLMLLGSCGNKTVETDSTVVYDAPKGLETVKGLEKSPFFALKVNGKESFVYWGFEVVEEFEWYGDAGVMTDSPSYEGISYSNFSISKGAQMVITSASDILEWDIKPTLTTAELSDSKTLTVTVDGPKKFVVMVRDAEMWRYFIVSAEEPETNIPDRNDPSVLFLEPGVHKYGQAWDPFVDGIKTLYVSGGAVLEATLKVKDKSDIKILGRGLLAQAFVPHAEEFEVRREQEWDADWLGVHFGRSKNIEVDGIAVINSPGYQMEFAICENVTAKNVKLLGFGEHNNDGFHTYGKNITLDDCFVTCNDDRICVTGLFDNDCGTGDKLWDGTIKLSGTPVSDITIRNMVFWGLHNNGGDIMLTWNGETYCKNVLIENCVSITPTNKAFVASMHAGSAIFENITIRNCHLYHGNFLSLLVRDEGYQGAGGGAIKGLNIENITLDVNKSEIGKHLTGFSETSNIEGIVVKNIRGKDGVVKSLNETAITTNEFVSNITVVGE